MLMRGRSAPPLSPPKREKIAAVAWGSSVGAVVGIGPIGNISVMFSLITMIFDIVEVLVGCVPGSVVGGWAAALCCY